ncbi:MAG TPA: hypothetical protein VIH57_23200 [Bacteroidales bacterium]
MTYKHNQKWIITTVIIINLIITSCFRNVCPDKATYQIYTKDELINNLWINKDSAINLQQKLLNSKSYYQYDEIDTLDFINEKQDTIPILIHNNLHPGQSYCSNYPMIGVSSIYPLKACFIKGLVYQMEKTIVTSDPIEFTINFELDDQSYACKYKLNDTTILGFGYTNGIVDKSKKTYIIPSIVSISLNTITIDNCVKFLFLDYLKNEILVAYYSNTYGFVKITKNKQYEITRTL